MSWNLNHHTVVSKTTIVRSCVPPWGILYWFISVPDDPYFNLLQFSSFFYQFSNLPSTSLSSLATHTWEDDEGADHNMKMMLVGERITLKFQASSSLTFFRHSLAPRWFLRSFCEANHFHRFPTPSHYLPSSYTTYTIIMIWEQWWMKLPSPVL